MAASPFRIQNMATTSLQTIIGLEGNGSFRQKVYRVTRQMPCQSSWKFNGLDIAVFPLPPSSLSFLNYIYLYTTHTHNQYDETLISPRATSWVAVDVFFVSIPKPSHLERPTQSSEQLGHQLSARKANPNFAP